MRVINVGVMYIIFALGTVLLFMFVRGTHKVSGHEPVH